MYRIKTVPALVLAASLIAIAMIAVLQARSDTSRVAQAELVQIGARLNERTSAPMGVMFGTPAPTVRARMALLQRQIEATVAKLRAETPVAPLDDVDRALERTFASDKTMLGLVGQMATEKGRAAIANALVTNDPGLNRTLRTSQENSVAVNAALDRTSDAYDRQAERARVQALIGSAGAIAILVLAFAFAYRRSIRARAVAERLAAENASLADASREEAFTDALTGLGNRRALIAALDDAIAGAHAAPVALALFDLDGFKQYNDSFGHQAGDALLRRLGERLAGRVDGVATAYRMGGDEFCVLTRDGSADAESLAGAAATALSEAGEAFAITCSFGIAQAPAEASSAEEALRLADQRMYEQKATRRNASEAGQTTGALLQVLTEQSGELAEHVSGVARLAASTAKRLGMTPVEVKQVHIAAQLHDVGKSAVPQSILNKPGPLADEEWEFVRRHTVIGERIVGAATSLAHAAPLIRSSHERVDGTGYPDRLRGDDIPLGARIIAVCDAFDAMVTDRPYRTGMPVAEALAELRRCAGSQFDRRVVEEFCRLADHLLDPPLAA
jgi:diguanylate cyclase (GGDEF)-like protein